MLIPNTRHFRAASFFPSPRAICMYVNLDFPALFSRAAFLKSFFSSFKQFNWISLFLFSVFLSSPRNGSQNPNLCYEGLKTREE